jgi:hypothetical protein
MASFARGKKPRSLSLVASSLVAAVATAGVASADGFRITTKVYVGDEEKPASETTTLFLDGAVYDFLTDPAQTAVFHAPAGSRPGRFVLLDPERRVRTELSTEKIARAMGKLRTWAAGQKDPFLQFAADPTFEESFDSASGELVLASHVESYTVSTVPIQRAAAIVEYREFRDWYTRLNTLLSAGPPAEPRLRLNEALARHKVVPLKVALTRAGEKEPLRAEHDFTWRLSRGDLDRIDDVRASLASYREVPNEEFLRMTQPPDEAN